MHPGVCRRCERPSMQWRQGTFRVLAGWMHEAIGHLEPPLVTSAVRTMALDKKEVLLAAEDFERGGGGVETGEAQEALKLAELARAEAAVAPSLSWTQKWSTIAPPQAEGEVFAIRLAETGQLLYSLWDFIDAMQHGLVDRTRGSYVPKHALEVAFVRSAADHLLLCTQDEKGFVHLPAPRTVSTGLSLEALWPLHGLALRLEGQTFPFSLHLTAADQRPLQFRGMGLHAISYQTPWNPLEYGDVLWASEAQDTLLFLPLLMVLSELVLDPHLSLGPFEPLSRHSSHSAGMQSDTRLPLASASLAVLQAALFHDVKMWPVALPPPARARYDFALRYLKLACQKVEEEHSSGRSPRLPGAEALRPEIVTRSLEALEKVPDDGDGSGGTPARGVLNTACSGFADRVKRMELSALSVPLKGCIVVRNAVEELLVLWPKFLAN
eukprot:symbB.v1.2.027071.t1/scaffold2752.1/size71575/4